MALSDEISAFYESGKEAGRLRHGLGRIELARMLELMSRFLPPAPAAIADIGGGPGVCACRLAEQGFAVHLVDAHPLHVEQAREASAAQPDHPLASVALGDARKLDMPDASVDSVLLCGPLYHLTDRCDRLQALGEARRLLRDGGVLLALGITAYASLIVGLVNGWTWDPTYMAMVREELTTGVHRCPEGTDYFTTAYFHQPQTLREEVEEAGFVCEALLGVEGPGWIAPKGEDPWADTARRETIMEIARLMEEHPAHSPHIMAVGRKTPTG